MDDDIVANMGCMPDEEEEQVVDLDQYFYHVAADDMHDIRLYAVKEKWV